MPFAFLIAKVSVLWSFVTAVTVHVGTGPVRALAVLGFFLAVPGSAVVGWLRLDDQAAVASLTVAIGIAVGIACGQILVWTHQWVPQAAFWSLAAACVASLAFQVARFRRRCCRSSSYDDPVTVLLVGLRLVSKRSFLALSSRQTLVPLMLALALLITRQVLWTNETDRARRLRLLPALAVPLITVVFVTVIARFAQLGHG